MFAIMHACMHVCHVQCVNVHMNWFDIEDYYLHVMQNAKWKRKHYDNSGIGCVCSVQCALSQRETEEKTKTQTERDWEHS